MVFKKRNIIVIALCHASGGGGNEVPPEKLFKNIIFKSFRRGTRRTERSEFYEAKSMDKRIKTQIITSLSLLIMTCFGVKAKI